MRTEPQTKVFESFRVGEGSADTSRPAVPIRWLTPFLVSRQTAKVNSIEPETKTNFSPAKPGNLDITGTPFETEESKLNNDSGYSAEFPGLIRCRHARVARVHQESDRMLELRHITKRYAGIPAVSNVSFVARNGEVTGYLGPNESGKSTTIKMIAGLIDPTDGEILFHGEPIYRDRLAYNQRLGYVPEEPQLYPHLTGAKYLEMVGELRGLPARPLAQKIDGFLRLLGLHGDRYALISSYSKGMRQKILLSAALLHNPELVVLDEPFSGLDLNSALVLRALIQQLAERGKVVLFSSHELETVERVSAHVVILHKGSIVANDSIERLRTLMSLPTLEEIFSQLAIEQDTAGITRDLLQVMEY
jgi:ABC-2 type transport system ATP-binding protein